MWATLTSTDTATPSQAPAQSAPGPMDQREHVQRQFLYHAASIRGYIYAMMPAKDEAEEIFQQTFLVAIEKADQYEPGTAFLAWVYQIARYEVLSHLRDNRRAAERNLSLEAIDLVTETAAHESSAEQRLPALRKCFNKLPDAAQKLLSLFYIDNLTGDTIAQKRGIKTQSVYNALDRARLKLRRCIEQELSNPE